MTEGVAPDSYRDESSSSHGATQKGWLFFTMGHSQHYVYIIYSRSLNRYYTGETPDVKKRLQLHNSIHDGKSFTSASDDWELKCTIACSSKHAALKIERHIKRMKSRKYLENLMTYPEMVDKLLFKYDRGGRPR